MPLSLGIDLEGSFKNEDRFLDFNESYYQIWLSDATPDIKRTLSGFPFPQRLQFALDARHIEAKLSGSHESLFTRV